MGPCISIEEVQQIIREMGMRQAICAPVFEGPDRATFTAGIKTKVLQSSPSTCYGTLLTTLSPVMGQDIYGVEQAIADVGETDKFWERV